MLRSLLIVLLGIQVVGSLLCPKVRQPVPLIHSTNPYVLAASTMAVRNQSLQQEQLLSRRHFEWLHIPKTGTSFFNTLLHRCSPDIPRMVRLSPNEWASNLLTRLNKKFTFCSIGVRGHGAFTKPNGCLSWMTMVREPATRLRSAFQAGGHANGLRDALLAQAEQAPTLTSFAASKGIAGCQTRLISGQGQCATPNLERSWVGEAIENLREHFAFVGITDRWDESICLFHAMYGGQVLLLEFANNRPSPSTRKVTDEEVDEAAAFEQYDNQVFQFAVGWFEEQMKIHANRVKQCLDKRAVRRSQFYLQ